MMPDVPDPEHETPGDLEIWRAALDSRARTARLCMIYLVRNFPAVVAAGMITAMVIWMFMR